MKVTRALASLCTAAAIALPAFQAAADEGGVSFWLPGTFGTLSATPQQPGWSIVSLYYHTSISAGGDVARSREFTIGRIPANAIVSLNAHLNATADLAAFAPTYVFQTPVLGGQAAVSMMGIVGRSSASITGNLSGTLTTPFGSLPFARSASVSSTETGFGDLYPQASLRWNQGVHNFMTYAQGDIPVGDYSSSRLANIGIGHGAIDGGGGYTYFNPQTGHEFSSVLGFTYNFVNPSTHYQNGVDFHLDWGASQFLTKQIQVGIVGYIYKEIGCDSGSGDHVGCFQSQVAGIGPQAGFIFPVGRMQGYLNLKGYYEFAAGQRPSGWNAWATFVISPAGAPPPQHPG